MNNMKLQPVTVEVRDSMQVCPVCYHKDNADEQELYGDGENHLCCPKCDYKIDERDIK